MSDGGRLHEDLLTLREGVHHAGHCVALGFGGLEDLVVVAPLHVWKDSGRRKFRLSGNTTLKLGVPIYTALQSQITSGLEQMMDAVACR